MPINVCYCDDVPDRETTSLRSFRSHVPPPLGEPLLLTRSTDDEGDDVRHMSLWKWLLEDLPAGPVTHSR